MNIVQNYAGVFTSVRKSEEVYRDSTVRVYRYLRHYMDDFGDFTNCEISNLGGVTFLFSIDQETGTLTYSYFICNKSDNFSKTIGRDKTTEQFDKGNIVKCIHYDRDISLLDNVFVDLLIKSRIKDADYIKRKLFILKNVFKEIYSDEELDYIESKLNLIEHHLSTCGEVL